MLTAKVAKENQILGLTIGADDYMIKPFNPNELIARIRAICSGRMINKCWPTAFRFMSMSWLSIPSMT
ncbi:hypothetical protein O9H85_28690 [Paenibacillus filicis]|uniref:Response regulatory domain-containing protein n=1 Tax=Paenibacillus gyeongsangnamensis TaxID=3388067 RepID=A0ABT4QHH1_9BACL|nr:hypothetical protein [Paenibacillus filicis]MCZ8516299.1 hypothetical protein [Paenibacillus filicis]